MGHLRIDAVPPLDEQWHSPDPILHLPEWLRDSWEWFDPSHSYRLLWPGLPERAELDILVAGCGTNQAAVLAHTNPRASVVAVDISQAALNHHQILKDRYGLKNLQLHCMSIEQLPRLDADFDLVVCTGVLHDLADPAASLAVLGQQLRADGVIGAMVYANYGRFGVELLESLFRDLGLAQDASSLRVVKDVIDLLPAQHPVRSYLRVAGGAQSDSALVDTFLRGPAQHFTVADCLDLVDAAGLSFQGWLLNAPYYPHPLLTPSTGLYPALDGLPAPRLWSAMERLHTNNACHFFMACHPQRSPESYAVDFTTAASRNYRPSWRMRCGLAGRELFRPDWSMKLTDAQRALARAVDGNRTIGAITDEFVADGSLPDVDANDLDSFTRNFFQELWRLDFLALGL